VINFENAQPGLYVRVSISERIKARTQDYVLGEASPDGFAKYVFGIAGACCNEGPE
jgi:hypothetical protein